MADDPEGQAALALWLDQKDDLLAGRTPRPKSDGLTIRELCDRYTVSNRTRMESGEITARTFTEVFATCRRLVDAFGPRRLVSDLAAEDFERLRKAIAKTWGPVRLGKDRPVACRVAG